MSTQQFARVYSTTQKHYILILNPISTNFWRQTNKNWPCNFSPIFCLWTCSPSPLEKSKRQCISMLQSTPKWNMRTMGLFGWSRTCLKPAGAERTAQFLIPANSCTFSRLNQQGSDSKKWPHNSIKCISIWNSNSTTWRLIVLHNN